MEAHVQKIEIGSNHQDYRAHVQLEIASSQTIFMDCNSSICEIEIFNKVQTDANKWNQLLFNYICISVPARGIKKEPRLSLFVPINKSLGFVWSNETVEQAAVKNI